MLVFHKLYGTTQSSESHRTESVSVTGHELTTAASSTGSSDQKQRYRYKNTPEKRTANSFMQVI